MSQLARLLDDRARCAGMADPELDRVNGIALTAVQALLGPICSAAVAVAVAAEEERGCSPSGYIAIPPRSTRTLSI